MSTTRPSGTCLEHYDGRMIILADTGFHRAQGDPANVKICRRGEWNVRMAVETTFAMMTTVWGSKVDGDI